MRNHAMEIIRHASDTAHQCVMPQATCLGQCAASQPQAAAVTIIRCVASETHRAQHATDGGLPAADRRRCVRTVPRRLQPPAPLPVGCPQRRGDRLRAPRGLPAALAGRDASRVVGVLHRRFGYPFPPTHTQRHSAPPPSSRRHIPTPWPRTLGSARAPASDCADRRPRPRTVRCARAHARMAERCRAAPAGRPRALRLIRVVGCALSVARCALSVARCPLQRAYRRHWAAPARRRASIGTAAAASARSRLRSRSDTPRASLEHP